MSFKDQRAARLLAMCNDIGEASYMSSHIAACLVDRLRQLPAADDNLQRLKERFGLDFTTDMTGICHHGHDRYLLHGGPVEAELSFDL